MQEKLQKKTRNFRAFFQRGHSTGPEYVSTLQRENPAALASSAA